MMHRLTREEIADLLYSALRFHIPKRWKLGEHDARVVATAMASCKVFGGVEVSRHDVGTFNDMLAGKKDHSSAATAISCEGKGAASEQASSTSPSSQPA